MASNQIMIFQEAKKAGLLELLFQLGFTPDKIKGSDYWYRSPFRQERTASFKVNRNRNIWYDHGEGIGGNIIDFAARFFSCDTAEAAKKVLELQGIPHFSFHQQPTISPQAGEKKESDQSRIHITATRPLQNNILLDYLDQRKIPMAVTDVFCKEVDFSLYGKQHTVIGFQNRSGGFELRSGCFKGSSAPKDISFFDRGIQQLSVFEGFFDLLSFVVIRPQAVETLTNLLVLNSLSFFDKSLSLMEQHAKVFLFLDQGKSGRTKTQQALELNKNTGVEKYIDCSHIYKGHDDLNAWLVAQNRQQKHQHQQQLIKPKGRLL